MSDELLSGFDDGDRALLLDVLEREDEAKVRASEPRTYRTPTDAELIAAGWKSPPPPLAGLLRELREAEREFGPGCWTAFSPDADDVLRVALKHQPELQLRRKVTKRDGEMWGIATTPAG